MAKYKTSISPASGGSVGFIYDDVAGKVTIAPSEGTNLEFPVGSTTTSGANQDLSNLSTTGESHFEKPLVTGSAITSIDDALHTANILSVLLTITNLRTGAPSTDSFDLFSIDTNSLEGSTVFGKSQLKVKFPTPPPAGVTDVQVDNTTVVSTGVANLKTMNADYDETTNPLATKNDLPAPATGGANQDLSNLTTTGEAHFAKPILTLNDGTYAGIAALGIPNDVNYHRVNIGNAPTGNGQRDVSIMFDGSGYALKTTRQGEELDIAYVDAANTEIAGRNALNKYAEKFDLLESSGSIPISQGTPGSILQAGIRIIGNPWSSNPVSYFGQVKIYDDGTDRVDIVITQDASGNIVDFYASHNNTTSAYFVQNGIPTANGNKPIFTGFTIGGNASVANGSAILFSSITPRPQIMEIVSQGYPVSNIVLGGLINRRMDLVDVYDRIQYTLNDGTYDGVNNLNLPQEKGCRIVMDTINPNTGNYKDGVVFAYQTQVNIRLIAIGTDGTPYQGITSSSAPAITWVPGTPDMAHKIMDLDRDDTGLSILDDANGDIVFGYTDENFDISTAPTGYDSTVTGPYMFHVTLDKNPGNDYIYVVEQVESGLKGGGYGDGIGNAITAPKELPSQTGNAGKYLTTDGTNPSWATPPGGGSKTLKTMAFSGNGDLYTKLAALNIGDVYGISWDNSASTLNLTGGSVGISSSAVTFPTGSYTGYPHSKLYKFNSASLTPMATLIPPALPTVQYYIFSTENVDGNVGSTAMDTFEQISIGNNGAGNVGYVTSSLTSNSYNRAQYSNGGGSQPNALSAGFLGYWS